MHGHKTMLTVIAVVVIMGLLVSPVRAHRKYRPNPSGPPWRLLVSHSHDAVQSDRSATPKPSKAKEFDLLGGAFGIVGGALKVVGDTVAGIFGDDSKQKALKAESEKRLSGRGRHTHTPNRSGTGLRWSPKH